MSAAVGAGAISATIVLGVVLMLRGFDSRRPPLEVLLAALHQPRSAPPSRRRRIDEAVEQFALVGLGGQQVDLAICERTVRQFGQQRLVWTILGASIGLFGTILQSLGVLGWITPSVALAVVVLGAVGGWFYALVDLRSDAARARREFITTLASFLELVSILMAGGAGVETALYEAAAIGRGRGARQIVAALSVANARREAPWREFGSLGRRIGVRELLELESSMTLAGEGASVRESLTAKAASLRERDLRQQEAVAQSRTETMVLPVAMMFAGFLLLIGYPALSGLSGP